MAENVGVRGVSREQHRQFRQELRDQKQSLHRNKEVLCDISTNRLDEAVRRLDQVRERGDALGDAFRKPKDVSAQAEIFRTLAGYGVEATNKLVQQQQGRGPMELVRALRAAFVHTRDPQLDGEEDPMAFCWEELAAATEHMRRPARGMHVMLGSLDAKPKERKAPAPRQKRQALGELTKPEVATEIPTENTKETDRNMETMWAIVKAQQGEVPVARLVCNHVSYGQTIENLFTLSFLLRDSRLGMKKLQGVGLVVWALEGKGGSKQQQTTKPAVQFVATVHEDDWRRMRAKVAPEECLMPHREGGPHEAGGKRRQSQGAAGPLAKRRRQ